MSHAVTLIVFHRRDIDEEKVELEDIQLAGTVEVSFDKLGANISPPSPTPPKNAPYIEVLKKAGYWLASFDGEDKPLKKGMETNDVDESEL